MTSNKMFLKNLLRDYYSLQISKLENLGFTNVLLRKNPYLLNAAGIVDAKELIDSLIDSYLQASSETMFGKDIFQPFARHVAKGEDSAIEGVDFHFKKGSTMYYVAVKSGPNIFSAASRSKQYDYFRKALKIHGTNSGKKTKIIPVVGYCYGTRSSQMLITGYNYDEYAGQAFWEFLSGKKNLYLQIASIITDARLSLQGDFREELASLKSRWFKEIKALDLIEDGKVDWIALTAMISDASA